MTFQMSPKALIEEELMEANSICDIHASEADKIIELLHKNESLDRENDRTRLEVRQHLTSALRAHTMRDYEGANYHIHAAIQRLQDQEQIDLKDDRPRIDAIIKLSSLKDKLQDSARRIRSFITKLNQKSTEAHS